MPRQTNATLFSAHETCVRGDLWLLGEHRLYCGDATIPENVARLFAGERFALCFTSPPYSDQRTYKLSSFDWQSVMCGAFDQIVAHGESDCHILVNLGLSHKKRQVDMYWLPWLFHCDQAGWPLFGWYVWEKNGVMFRENDGRLFMSHEFIFHFNRERRPSNKWIASVSAGRVERGGLRGRDGNHKAICSPVRIGQPTRVPSSVIPIHKESSSSIFTRNHPAVFPVALPEFMMRTWSQPGDIVYEPFCGSGTSIIAAENLQRRCYAMEIEPSYCALAIRRWQEHTGQQARRVELGGTSAPDNVAGRDM